MSYNHNFLVFFFFFFFFWGGGGGGGGWGGNRGTWPFTLREHWKITHFLGKKTNVRECLKIILRNKTYHKKNLCLLYPFLPTYIPPTQHILWHFLEIIIHFWSYCYQ